MNIAAATLLTHTAMNGVHGERPSRAATNGPVAARTRAAIGGTRFSTNARAPNDAFRRPGVRAPSQSNSDVSTFGSALGWDERRDCHASETLFATDPAESFVC